MVDGSETALERQTDSAMSTRTRFELELVPSVGVGDRLAEQQTVALADELKTIRGVTVERARTQAPGDAKALDVVAIGALIGSLAPVAGAVSALVGALRAWMRRGEGRKLRVRVGENEFEMTGATPADEQQLMELFMKAVERG